MPLVPDRNNVNTSKRHVSRFEYEFSDTLDFTITVPHAAHLVDVLFTLKREAIQMVGTDAPRTKIVANFIYEGPLVETTRDIFYSFVPLDVVFQCEPSYHYIVHPKVFELPNKVALVLYERVPRDSQIEGVSPAGQEASSDPA